MQSYICARIWTPVVNINGFLRVFFQFMWLLMNCGKFNFLLASCSLKGSFYFRVSTKHCPETIG